MKPSSSSSLLLVLLYYYYYVNMMASNITLFLKYRSIEYYKPRKIREIEIVFMKNREKSGENVKKSGITKFAHNFLKLLLL